MFKVVVFKQPRFFVKSEVTKRHISTVPDNYVPSVSSLRRTKEMVRDIALCNDFDLFCTFTFDPKKCNSFSLPACWHKISVWVHNQREVARNSGRELKYLFIPERHKSGRWHFHALISGYSSTIRPSGVYSVSYRPVFNLTSFRSGFTTAVYIDSKEGVSNYITKYITKDFIKTFNQRRFFCSRNLIRPTKTTNSTVVDLTLPLFRRKLYESENSYEYCIDKSFNVCNNKLNVAQYRDCDYIN